MKQDTLIDYAAPCMAAEKALRDLHNAVLEGKYDEAMKLALEAAAEARLTYHAIAHMKDQHALRQQTPPV
jgi:chemotaxis regulatin CheY-phosphate phosphatase CheZ